jgi:hypothetical protein
MEQFIVLEMFGTPSIVTDEEGDVRFFDSEEEAQIEADDCQDGRVIPV